MSDRVLRIIRDCAWRNGRLTELCVLALAGKDYDHLVEESWLKKEKL